MKRKFNLTGILTALLLAALLPAAGCTLFDPDELRLSGLVEAPVVAHYSEVSGKLISAPLNLGQPVLAGEVVAQIDAENTEYQIEQLESALLTRQMELEDLLNEADAAAVQQARNNITIAEQGRAAAELTLQRAQDNCDKALYLYDAGAISQDERDNAQTALEQAQNAYAIAAAQVDNARQQLSITTTGASTEKITAAQAVVAANESQLRQLREQLARHTITALTDGTVISKNYEKGDLVAPGYDLLDLSETAAKYVSAWTPVKHLNAIEYGQAVRIESGSDQYPGTITWIDLQSEYTPEDRQSADNKNKVSVKIKVTPDEDCPLKPGQEVRVVIPLPSA